MVRVDACGTAMQRACFPVYGAVPQACCPSLLSKRCPNSSSSQPFERSPIPAPFFPFHPPPSLDQGQIIMTDFSHQPQAVEQQPLPWLHEQRHYK